MKWSLFSNQVIAFLRAFELFWRSDVKVAAGTFNSEISVIENTKKILTENFPETIFQD